MPRGITPRRPALTRRQEGTQLIGKPLRAERQSARRKLTSKGAEAHPSKMAKLVAAPVVDSRSAKLPGPKKNYKATDPDRVAEILKRLDQLYPDVTCALTHKSAWELLVATILSAQSTDVRVNMVTPELFKKYSTVQDFAKIEPQQLEPDIRSTGFFRNKSKSVVGAARKIVNEFGGRVPETMEELLTLPGVARKTANVVLGTWFKRADGVVVDTHVQRISRRLELTKNDDPKKIEADLMKVIPREKWILFSHQVIWHGRKLCVARSPKCADCMLENICHAEDKTWSTVDKHKGAKV